MAPFDRRIGKAARLIDLPSRPAGSYRKLADRLEPGVAHTAHWDTGHRKNSQQALQVHSHSLDGCCGLNLQLNSNPSALTYPDNRRVQLTSMKAEFS
jgi:hypothetical protein